MAYLPRLIMKTTKQVVLTLSEYEAIMENLDYNRLPESTALVLDHIEETIKEGGEVVFRKD